MSLFNTPINDNILSGKINNGRMRKLQRMATIHISFRKRSWIALRSRWPMKFDDKAADPFVIPSHIKIKKQYIVTAIPCIVARSFETWLKAAYTKYHANNSMLLPIASGLPI